MTNLMEIYVSEVTRMSLNARLSSRDKTISRSLIFDNSSDEMSGAEQ